MEERVAAAHDLRDGEMTVVSVGGKKLLLARVDGAFHATAARCPHWGGPLPQGNLTGHRLLCPWHKATYDVLGGVLLEPPALDGITTYRVRIEGEDVFVSDEKLPRPADENMATFDPSDGRLFVIIGAGAAAQAAAEELRRQGYAGRLLMIGPEEQWPYDRPNLSKDYLAGELEARWLPLRSPEFYEEHDIERVTGRVAKLDVVSRTITQDDGTVWTPDAVLIASGALPRRLDVPGADLPGVLTLRSWADADALLALARGASRAVIVGASFIGMEAAASLRRRGLDVTVTAPSAVPFAAALGEDVGRIVQAVHAERGTRFALGRKVIAIQGDSAVHGVELDGGEVLDADLVLVGIGVTPATAFARGVARDDDGGIPVDGELRVAAGVWAAGDVARYPDVHTGRDVRIEHWRLAEQHGRAAARSMAGRGASFTGVPFFWTQHFDLQLGYAGPGHGWDEVVIAGDPKEADFLALYAADGRLVAACGTRDRELGAFIELMRLGRLPALGEIATDSADALQSRLAGVAP